MSPTSPIPAAAGGAGRTVTILDHRRWGVELARIDRLAAGLAAASGRAPATLADELRRFLAAFDAQRDGFWTLVVDGEAAGCIALAGDAPPAAALRWWQVAPAWRGRGLGMALLDRALHAATRQPRPLRVREPVKGAAARLLARAGFVPLGPADWLRPR